MIAPTNTISPEWGNENALRSYPLRDDCVAAEVIPEWLIADMRVTVDVAYTYVFVSSIYVSDTIVSVGVSGATATGNPVGLLTKTLTRDELEPFSAYSMDRMTGLASGSISFGGIPDGTSGVMRFSFTRDSAPIVTSAIARVKTPGVTRIVDKAHGTYADGIIDLSGNSEFRTYLDPTDATGKTIIVELADMYRDMTTSVCNSTPSFDACEETPVKTINGVAPDDNGTLTLRFR